MSARLGCEVTSLMLGGIWVSDPHAVREISDLGTARPAVDSDDGLFMPVPELVARKRGMEQQGDGDHERADPPVTAGHKDRLLFHPRS